MYEIEFYEKVHFEKAGEVWKAKVLFETPLDLMRLLV